MKDKKKKRRNQDVGLYMKELRIKTVVNIEKKYKVGLLIKVKIDNLVISDNPYWIFVDKE